MKFLSLLFSIILMGQFALATTEGVAPTSADLEARDYASLYLNTGRLNEAFYFEDGEIEEPRTLARWKKEEYEKMQALSELAKREGKKLNLIIGRGNREPVLPETMTKEAIWVYNNRDGMTHDRTSSIPHLYADLTKKSLLDKEIYFDEIMMDWSTAKFFTGNQLKEIIKNFLKVGGIFKTHGSTGMYSAIAPSTNRESELKHFNKNETHPKPGADNNISAIAYYNDTGEILVRAYTREGPLPGTNPIAPDFNKLLAMVAASPAGDDFYSLRRFPASLTGYEAEFKERSDRKTLKALDAQIIPALLNPLFRAPCTLVEEPYPSPEAEPAKRNDHYIRCEGFNGA